MKRTVHVLSLLTSLSLPVLTAMDTNPDYRHQEVLARIRAAVLDYPLTHDAALAHRMVINQFAQRLHEGVSSETRKIIAGAIVRGLRHATKREFDEIIIASRDLDMHRCLLAAHVDKAEALRNARALQFLRERGELSEEVERALESANSAISLRYALVVYRGASSGGHMAYFRARRDRTRSVTSLFEFLRLDAGEAIPEVDEDESETDE